jgi:hypothetical protein
LERKQRSEREALERKLVPIETHIKEIEDAIVPLRLRSRVDIDQGFTFVVDPSVFVGGWMIHDQESSTIVAFHDNGTAQIELCTLKGYVMIEAAWVFGATDGHIRLCYRDERARSIVTNHTKQFQYEWQWRNAELGKWVAALEVQCIVAVTPASGNTNVSSGNINVSSGNTNVSSGNTNVSSGSGNTNVFSGSDTITSGPTLVGHTHPEQLLLLFPARGILSFTRAPLKTGALGHATYFTTEWISQLSRSFQNKMPAR